MGKKKGGKKSKMTPEEIAQMEANNKKYADLGNTACNSSPCREP